MTSWVTYREKGCSAPRLGRAILTLTALASVWTAGCAGGVPVRVRIDEFTMEFSIDEAIKDAFTGLKSSGLLPAQTGALPELWPQSLPRVQYTTVFTSPPVPVDLTPDPESPDFKKYEAINNAAGAINRIEINRMILRVEQSTLSVPLPELQLQVAPDATTDPAERRAWRTVAVAKASPPGFVGDVEFVFEPSGESFLNSQLSDEARDFAIRIRGRVHLDTDENPRLPRGAAGLRLIIVATFFVDPEGALQAANEASQ